MKSAKKYILFLILLSSTVVFPNGKLFIVGGGQIGEYILKHFVELAGGTDKNILIIPLASENPIKAATSFSNKLKDAGCTKISVLYASRENIDNDSNIVKINSASAIFFTGGDQSKLTQIFLNTKALKRIKSVYKHGSVIGGTSAGAAIMSKIMITGKELISVDSSNAYNSITSNNIETTEGFGLLENVIVDQHFIKRKRINRLISLVLQNKNKLGVGIDESTAIIVDNNKFRVVGESLVTVIDASKVKNSGVNKNNYQSASGIIIHLLKEGDAYKILN